VLQRIALQWANLEDCWACGHGIVGDGSVAACEYDIGLAADGGGACWCGGDGEGEASRDGSGSDRLVSMLLLVFNLQASAYGTKTGPVTVMKAP